MNTYPEAFEVSENYQANLNVNDDFHVESVKNVDTEERNDAMPDWRDYKPCSYFCEVLTEVAGETENNMIILRETFTCESIGTNKRFSYRLKNKPFPCISTRKPCQIPSFLCTWLFLRLELYLYHRKLNTLSLI